jgi:hypothetical protein
MYSTEDKPYKIYGNRRAKEYLALSDLLKLRGSNYIKNIILGVMNQ